jgi:hypothetical protein
LNKDSKEVYVFRDVTQSTLTENCQYLLANLYPSSHFEAQTSMGMLVKIQLKEHDLKR